MISAGRVLLIPRGDYDPTETYGMLDIVSYNGSSYIATRTTTGNLPTNTTYWQLSAYGGQASNLAGNFAPLETTDYATRPYQVDEIFVDKDSQLVVATDAINIGDEIEIGSNCEITTIADLLDDIKNHYDALDQRNRKLIGITQLTAQTDLHSLVPGEYYKKLTNFYVTNGPTGINQVPTAVFRLTVESGLDESSSSILLTLRATDGKVYTQSYDGTSWSAWVEVSSKAYVDSQISSLGTAASKDSTNAVTQGSTDLVESGAVYTEIQTLANQTANQTAKKTDLTSIIQTGTTASQSITIGRYFYLNGALVKAKTAIASGATFTLNTNYEVVANGGFNDLMNYYLGVETPIGIYVNKILYRKVIDVGVLPSSAGIKKIKHNITGNFTIRHVYGYASTGTTQVPLPFPNSATSTISVSVTGSQVNIEVFGDRSAYTEGQIVLEYTKD